MRYRLSKLIPVPMRSTYTALGAYNQNTMTSGNTVQITWTPQAKRQTSRWIQWRGRAYRHRVTAA